MGRNHASAAAVTKSPTSHVIGSDRRACVALVRCSIHVVGANTN